MEKSNKVLADCRLVLFERPTSDLELAFREVVNHSRQLHMKEDFGKDYWDDEEHLLISIKRKFDKETPVYEFAFQIQLWRKY